MTHAAAGRAAIGTLCILGHQTGMNQTCPRRAAGRLSSSSVAERLQLTSRRRALSDRAAFGGAAQRLLTVARRTISSRQEGAKSSVERRVRVLVETVRC